MYTYDDDCSDNDDQRDSNDGDEFKGDDEDETRLKLENLRKLMGQRAPAE